MSKKYFISFWFLFIIIFLIPNCLTDSKKLENNNLVIIEPINESFQKTGWLSDSKYRSVMYIITDEECKNNTPDEIEEKIKYEAYKQLQKEFNPSFDKFAASQIKKLVENSGKMVNFNKRCAESNIYFYDIEKKDLKSDLMNIKNMKK